MKLSFAMLVVGSLAGLWAGASGAEPEDSHRSQVLGLVSLEYQLAGKPHPRTHELAAYRPLFDSPVAEVGQVARLSVLWEIAAREAYETDREFLAKVEEVIGVDAAGRPSAGALKRYLNDEGVADSYRELVESQSDRHAMQVKLAQLQDKLWDRAEALARSGAGVGELDLKRLEISFGERKGLGWAITVRNRSAEAIPGLTLAAVTKLRPLPPEDPLAALLLFKFGELTGEESGQALRDSLVNDRKLKERPFRILAHVPALPAGTSWEVMLLRDHFELARCESATYSLWADDLAVAGEPLPGFALRAQQAQKKASIDANATRKKLEADAQKAAKRRRR